MTKNQKGIIAVLVTASIVIAGWKMISSGKKAQVTYLVKNNFSSGTVDDLMTFGNDYIKAWHKAAKAGQPSFLLNGISYNTKGGKKL